MGPMWNKMGGLPKEHWIHKALAKEHGRMAKKKGSVMTAAKSEKVEKGEYKESDMLEA